MYTGSNFPGCPRGVHVHVHVYLAIVETRFMYSCILNLDIHVHSISGNPLCLKLK